MHIIDEIEAPDGSNFSVTCVYFGNCGELKGHLAADRLVSAQERFRALSASPIGPEGPPTILSRRFGKPIRIRRAGYQVGCIRLSDADYLV